MTVAGQSVDLAQEKDEVWLGQTLTSLARAFGAAEEPAVEDEDGWPGAGLGGGEPAVLAGAPARSVSGRELLLGSAFHLAREGEAGGPGLAAWGHVRVGGFDGEAPAETGNVRIDGEVTTGILGTDAERDRLLAGVAMAISSGDGTFDQPGVDSGTFETTMTTVSPFPLHHVEPEFDEQANTFTPPPDPRLTSPGHERRIEPWNRSPRHGYEGPRSAPSHADTPSAPSCSALARAGPPGR